ncbi:ribonuclease HI [Novosphingobium jiangmenense]|uniref:Reverse transcriptase-like protein n=1 Tax=Novosphingobium jiangmenense TaxID=2791981 RepID=A0ABS0HAT5_9SPHN|nr:reverse transcriptase-like protein [Novosphingobium jiangmenense]MBF9149386.1 reverse transcriptase-like protein [Novosphingobium jiangmenense]
MERRIKVYFDGGCRPNPGPMEAAVVIRGRAHVFDDLGSGTNTQAEWQALLCALELAQAAGLKDFDLLGDSREVTGAANRALVQGQASTGPAQAFLALAAGHPPRRVRWIARAQNLAGIALEKRRESGAG